MKEIPVKRTDKHNASGYLRKAESFYAGMKSAEQAGDWNMACLAAVHCTISTTDALTTWYLGTRSAGKSHEDAVQLIYQLAIPQAREHATQFLAIIAEKNRIEYDAQELPETRAANLAKQAERYHKWAKQYLRDI